MERLTEWDELGNADIIALSDVMPEIYAELSFSEANDLTDALNRLAAYEDAMPLERAQELARAEKDGRLVVLEPAAKEGEPKPPCFYNDMGQALCLGFARGECDDEPIDRCKECWYCESTREEAGTCTLALKKIEGEGANMNTEVLFSSKSEMWETPQDFFDKLDEEFHFTLDVCATPENTKCERYYTPEMDGLSQPWEGVCWCNPPYCRQTGKWVRKAHDEAGKGNCAVVMLLPCRPDVAWFHDYILGRAEIRFIRGRLKFGGSKNSAPFPSMVVVFRPKIHRLAQAIGGDRHE